MTNTALAARIVERQKRSKIPLATDGGRISQKPFKRGSRNLTKLLWTIVPTNLPDMTLLAVSGHLKNSTKYCTNMIPFYIDGRQQDDFYARYMPILHCFAAMHNTADRQRIGLIFASTS